MKWIHDEELVKTDSPMTKYAIRVLSMAMMDLDEGLKFLDIGCGTGSVTVQAAAFNMEVTSIDKFKKATDATVNNLKLHNLKAKVIEGNAPYDLPIDKYDRIFVGGSGGNLDEICNFINDNLNEKGITLANFIIMKNAINFKEGLKKLGFNVEVRVINSSVEDKLGLMKADNPVIIVKGYK